MRVLIDARMLIGRFSGVARVVTRLIDELARRDGLHVAALCGRQAYEPWGGRRDIEVVTSTFSRDDRTAHARWGWEQANLPEIIRDANVDLFHATWNSGVPKLADVPSVLTIHDLIPWHEPEEHFRGLAEAWWYRHAVRTSAHRAARVTAVSEFVRQDALTRMRLAPEKVAHVPDGVDLPTCEPDIPPTERPYVLYVGGHERRKNLAALFRALQRYWERYGMTLELRVTGRASTLSADAGEALLRLPVDAPVRFLGDVSDEELARQYRSARALLLLSRAEGFGLPVLEAMAYRCPVIAAARAALPEVVGDAGVLVDPDDMDQVRDAVFSLVPPSAFRDEVVARGLARAACFRWNAVADRYLQVYREALSVAAPHGPRRRRPASPSDVRDPAEAIR